MQTVIRYALAGALLVGGHVAVAQEKLIIRSLESPEVLEAQFNPTEIGINQTVPWKTHKSSTADVPTLEFTAGAPRTLQAELLFDTFESGDDVQQLYIARLQGLAAVDPVKKRPPLVQLEWGQGFPSFRGVVEHLDVRYTLFLPTGVPVRAAVELTLREAAIVRAKRGVDGNVVECSTPSNCPLGQSCFNGVCAPEP